LISIYAEIDGEIKLMGTFQYKVIDIPISKAKVSGKS